LLPISTADKTNNIGGIPIIPIGDTEKIKSKEYNQLIYPIGYPLLAELAGHGTKSTFTMQAKQYVFSYFPEIKERWPFTLIPEKYFDLFKEGAYVKDPETMTTTSTDPEESWLLGGRDCKGIVDSEKFGGMCE
jgi:hypothetical protein